MSNIYYLGLKCYRKFSKFSKFAQISLGLELQRAAHGHNASSIYCNNETGRVFFSILKYLIRLIACST